jgi:hypothetical protein
MFDLHHPNTKARLIAKFLVTPGCWVWTANLNSKGYGTISVEGRSKLAHRVSYEIYVGKIPDGLDLLHRCDNGRCVNPDHLFPGTHKENMADMARKGRAFKHMQKGESNNGAKLTDSQVLAIYADTRASAVIADEYGIFWNAVYDIKKKKRWGHILNDLTDPPGKALPRWATPRAKLTEGQVKQIYADSRVHSAIAKDFEISRSLVGQIKAKKIWQNILN